MDVLSDVLRTIRLEGALFLNADLRAPWCFNVPRGIDIAQVLQPKAERLAIFHLVLEGGCWAQVTGGQPVRLGPGDIVTIPHGDTHVVGSALQHASVEISNVIQPRVPELARIRYGGDGERTLVACGWFAYEGGSTNNVLIENLPPLFSTNIRARPSGTWIEQSVGFVLGEGAARNPGSDVLASKVAELVLAEALLGYIESLPKTHSGWLAGLRDPLVAKCLALMHAEPSKAWTIETLAHDINSSRSVLAQRFVDTVGMPPMQYLARWRMVVAAGLLRKQQGTLARVAQDVGYESEAAFNRAFKREYGMSPGVWRQGGAQQAPAAA